MSGLGHRPVGGPPLIPWKDKTLPGPDGDSGYVWPSWREAILDAAKGVDRAYERRREVFQAAYDAGLTIRQIAAACDLSGPTVHKIIGRQKGRDQNALLDAPAFQPKGRER